MIAEIVFYNGFNLLVDVVLVSVAALWFHGVGYRKGKRVQRQRMKDYIKPPF